MPDTKPGVNLDERGICNACRSVEKKKKINWEKRYKKLEEIAQNIKKQDNPFYDCIVPVSGGKNSWFQAYMASEKLGLKTLCVVLAAHVPTTEGIHNLNTMVEDLNVDLVKVTLKPSVYKKIRKKNFLLQAEPNWAEHNCVFSSVLNVALLYDVPLVVWGEDIAFEFGGEQNEDSTANAININENDLIGDKTVKDWLGDDINPRDIFFYEYPEHELLNRKNIKSIYLGHFIKWEGREQYEFVKRRGFVSRIEGPLSGNYIDYDNIDEKLCEINIWLKYIKFGFWRPTDQTCYDIWNEKLSREEAVKIVLRLQDEFPKEYFNDFLRFHELSKNDFWSTVEKFRNKDLWKKSDRDWILKDKIS
tara:strand:- start:447 stop:1529 length:1083 start_codon:yes stop_codon:yes gene_type:complete